MVVVSMTPLGQTITIYAWCVMYIMPHDPSCHLIMRYIALVVIWRRHADDHHVQGSFESESDRRENQSASVSLLGQTIKIYAWYVMYMIPHEPSSHLIMRYIPLVVI